MNTIPEHRFVSLPDTNNIPSRSSGDNLSHVHSLLPHYLPATGSPGLVPIPKQHYALVSRDVSGVPTIVPVVEFSAPLQLARAAYPSSDLQSNSSTIFSRPQQSYIAHVVEGSSEIARRPGMLPQASAFINVCGAIAALESTTGAVPSRSNSTVVSGDAMSVDSLPPTMLFLDDRDSSYALPNDASHVVTSDSGNLFDLAFLPPVPVLVRHSPELFCTEHDAHRPTVQDAKDPSAAATSRIWSLPSAISSLSFSGSEDNLPLALSSGKFYYNDLFRLSLSPPLVYTLDDVAPSAAPLIGLYADVNMRHLAIRAQSPPLCVNPADVMSDSLRMPSPSSGSFGSPGPDQMVWSASASPQMPDFKQECPEESLVGQDFSDETISAIVSVLRSSETSQAPQLEAPPVPYPERSDQENVSPIAGPPFYKVVAPQPIYPQIAYGFSGNDLGILPSQISVAGGCPEVPGPDVRLNERMPLADIYVPQPYHVGPSYVMEYNPPVDAYTFPAAFPAAPVHSHPAPVAEPLEPVLNAHLGVSLEDIRRRAAENRQRNGGAELDKSFLQCFAGRLTARGELMEEYRCYVTGCEQRNRRRDHILVHVGSHVEHRPWACRSCGMRFLRKNECKRHESSHEGKKPFSCQLCAPFQERCFVRQDLLKRHMRVTHGVQDAKRRKKEHVKNENDYWP